MGDYLLNNSVILKDRALEWNPGLKRFLFVGYSDRKRDIISLEKIQCLEQLDEGKYQVKYGPSFSGGKMTGYSRDFWKSGRLLLEKDEIIKIGSHPFWLFEPGMVYMRGF